MGSEKKEGLAEAQESPPNSGRVLRSKPAVVSVKRAAGERVRNMRWAGPQAYFMTAWLAGSGYAAAEVTSSRGRMAWERIKGDLLAGGNNFNQRILASGGRLARSERRSGVRSGR